MGTAKVTSFETFFIASTGSTFFKIMVAPIEYCQLQLRTQDFLMTTGKIKTPYSGLLDCFMRTLKEQGFLHFWRGNRNTQLNVSIFSFTQGLNFTFVSLFKSFLFSSPNILERKADYLKFFAINCISGGLAGISSLIILYPLNEPRVVKAININQPFSYKYRGFCIAALGIFIYRSLYFGLFDSLQIFIPDLYSSPISRFRITFLIAFCTTNIAGMLSYPITIIRSGRIAMQSKQAVSSLEIAKTLWKREGSLYFFKGYTSTVVGTIASAAVLSTFDLFTAIYLRFPSPLR